MKSRRPYEEAPTSPRHVRVLWRVSSRRKATQPRVRLILTNRDGGTWHDAIWEERRNSTKVRAQVELSVREKETWMIAGLGVHARVAALQVGKGPQGKQGSLKPLVVDWPELKCQLI